MLEVLWLRTLNGCAQVDANLAAAGLLPSDFDAVVAADKFEAIKPAPDIFLAAAKLMGTPPQQCVVVEDAVAGVQAAQNAGEANHRRGSSAPARHVVWATSPATVPRCPNTHKRRRMRGQRWEHYGVVHRRECTTTYLLTKRWLLGMVGGVVCVCVCVCVVGRDGGAILTSCRTNADWPDSGRSR